LGFVSFPSMRSPSKSTIGKQKSLAVRNPRRNEHRNPALQAMTRQFCLARRVVEMSWSSEWWRIGVQTWRSLATMASKYTSLRYLCQDNPTSSEPTKCRWGSACRSFGVRPTGVGKDRASGAPGRTPALSEGRGRPDASGRVRGISPRSPRAGTEPHLPESA
jgi:hypothetical protein